MLALVALPFLLAAGPASASGTVVPYSITVDGQTATGLLGVPADPAPTVLVVLAHGFGGAASSFGGYYQYFADNGWLAVGMDYRGAQGAWKVKTGWEDTVAATLDLKAQYPSVQRVVLWGISMGGEVSGLAVAHAPPGTYTYWVDDAGVQNLAEEWAEVPGFQGAIQAETGGTPAQVPQAYVDRSPALQADAIAAHGLARAFFFHYAADDVVPVTHARETAEQLAARGVPVSFYTLASAGACHCSAGAQATIEKAQGRPDWVAPLVEGTLAPSAGFVPPISSLA
jgi:dipeptidyl aminopeptidase/acylaminoacyl peptidase